MYSTIDTYSVAYTYRYVLVYKNSQVMGKETLDLLVCETLYTRHQQHLYAKSLINLECFCLEF